MIEIRLKDFRPIDRTLTGTTTPGQSGTESNDNEKVLRTGASPLDGLMSYPGYLLRRLAVAPPQRYCQDMV